jgi:hypothetical protein
VSSPGSRHPNLVPETLDGYVLKKAFCVLYPTYGARVQLMWRRLRKYPLDWKAPLPVLKAELIADTPPHWHPIFEASMTEDIERQVLHVLCDRLRRWWAPGALLLGDAAHTMSPIGGQGLTVAIRDAIVAANHIIRAHRDGSELDDALCQRIEAERRPEIEELQAFQQRAGRINDAPPVLQWLMANAISDYTYQAILERAAAVNGQAEIPASLDASVALASWRLLVSDSAGVHWVKEPLSVRGTPEGDPTSAVIHRADGSVEHVLVYKQRLEDGVSDRAFMLTLPEPDASWRSIEIPRLLTRQPF